MTERRSKQIHYERMCTLLYKSNAPESKKKDLFYTVCKRGEIEVCQMFIDNGISELAKTEALSIACHYYHFDICKLLIEHNVTITDSDAYILLQLLCEYLSDNNWQKEMVDICRPVADYFIRHPPPLTNEISLLCKACRKNTPDMLQFLLSSGADVNFYKTGSRSTALMFACSINCYRSCKLLIEYGANINAQNTNGSTALMFATDGYYTEEFALLLQNGADINLTNNNGQTALHIAAINENLSSCKCLIEHGADVSARDNVTPFFLLMCVY
jgi:ankyrin repeat protein